jgi:hypothetical protein
VASSSWLPTAPTPGSTTSRRQASLSTFPGQSCDSFKLTLPEAGMASPGCFRSLAAAWRAGMLGLHATPECSGHLSATWPPPPAPGTSLLGDADLRRPFRSLPGRLLPLARFLVGSALALAGPAWIEATHLAFYSPRRVKTTAPSGLDAPLVLFGKTSAPWPCSGARSLCPSQWSVAGAALWSIQARPFFPRLSSVPEWSVFILADTRTLTRGFTTLLSIASADVVRPRARYARNPFPSGRESTPWPPPTCARFLLQHPTFNVGPFD